MPTHRGELLLELLSQEIPARYQRRAIEDLTRLVRDKLAAADIPAADIKGYVTPRRLTIIADGIPATQPDRSEERRGRASARRRRRSTAFCAPPGSPRSNNARCATPAAANSISRCIRRPGRAAAAVLPDLVKDAIAELPWPKSMRYPASSLRWVRPLTSVVCLFDGTVLPFELGQVPVGRVTRGHRLIAPSEIAVKSAPDYLAALEAAHVVLDQDRRRETIAAQLDRAASAAGVLLKADPALQDEVTGSSNGRSC